MIATFQRLKCGTDSTKINVLRSLISAQPGFVLPTEAAEDAPIWDATRVRVTSFSVQRESFCVYRLHLFNISSGFGSIYHFPNSHGGGKRCKLDGCHKSAVGGSLYCTGHGGGKRCSVLGCDKSAQSSTKFCVKHGGGKKCSFEGCKKVARGRTLFCAAVSNIPTIGTLFMCLLLTIFNAF